MLSMILVPGVPFVLAVVLLQVLGPHRGPEVGFASLTEGHLPGLIVFCTAAVAQIAVCLAAFYAFAHFLMEVPAKVRYRGLLIGIPFAFGMLLALALMPDHGGAAGKLTFQFFGDVFALSGADWLHDGGGGWIPSRLFLAYFLPSALGVIAVVAAAVAMAAVVTALPRPDASEWSTYLERSHTIIRNVLYLLTLILVLSTFAASLFFHLPVELFHKAARVETARFANELSVFWGTVYSLTLVATVAPAIFILQQRTRRAVADLPDAEVAKAKALLASNSLVGGLKRQAELVVALLAPMIAGPLANAFQAVLV